MYRKSILCGMLLLCLGCNKDGGIGKGRSSDGEAPQVFALLKGNYSAVNWYGLSVVFSAGGYW